MFRRLWEKIKALWKLARSERASPREIGWAVAIGAFAGCTPALGFHGVVGLALATLCRKNRLFAWLGTRISNMMILPFIVIAEIEVAHRVRTGEWIAIAIDHDHPLDAMWPLLLDWMLGCIPVGGAIALMMGLVSWGIAHWRAKRALRPSLPEDRSPSSESLS